MLHNSGPFGPSETPISTGIPVNMGNMSTPISIGHNLSNLAKIAQQGPQTANERYNPSEYPSFSQSPLSIGSQMDNFPNIYPLNFQPPFLSQQPTSLHGASWQNHMLPVNLHTPPINTLNLENNRIIPDNLPPNSVKTSFKEEEQINPREMPISIPQVPITAFQNNDSNNYNLFNVNRDKFNHYYQSYDEKGSMDNTKRKSLENTVRLIEDMLINTTKSKEAQVNNKIEKEKRRKKSKSKLKPRADSNITNNKTNLDTESSKTNCLRQRTIKEDNNCKKDESEDKSQEMETQTVKEQPSEANTTVKVKDETDLIPPIAHVDIKVEPLEWSEEYNEPFHRDINGINREEVDDTEIVDSENSINEATEAVKTVLGLPNTAFYECPYCNLLFNHPKRFLIHTKWHTFGLTNEKRNEMAKERDIWRQQRREARVLNKMVSEEVTDSNQNKSQAKKAVYQCKEKDCGKAFVTKGSLKHHRHRSHPSRPKDCKICGETLVGWLAMREHMAVHTSPTGTYQCADCPKVFKFKHSLAKHRDTHLEKTVSCESCPKKFGTEGQLKMHMKVHERHERGLTHRCSYCGKGFYENYNLTVHERTHRNERPYVCQICNTSYGTNSSLKRHLKVSHNSSKPFECEVCHRCFVSENIRDKHRVRAHGSNDDFPFHCENCECKYLTAKDLKQHVKKTHIEPKAKTKKAKEESESDTDSE